MFGIFLVSSLLSIKLSFAQTYINLSHLDYSEQDTLEALLEAANNNHLIFTDKNNPTKFIVNTNNCTDIGVKFVDWLNKDLLASNLTEGFDYIFLKCDKKIKKFPIKRLYAKETYFKYNLKEFIKPKTENQP